MSGDSIAWNGWSHIRWFVEGVPRKVWLALNREGIEVARCTVERLMADGLVWGDPRQRP